MLEPKTLEQTFEARLGSDLNTVALNNLRRVVNAHILNPYRPTEQEETVASMSLYRSSQPSSPTKMRTGGVRVDRTTAELLQNHDIVESQLVEFAARSGSLVVDLGAGKSDFLNIFAGHVPAGRRIAVEFQEDYALALRSRGHTVWETQALEANIPPQSVSVIHDSYGPSFWLSDAQHALDTPQMIKRALKVGGFAFIGAVSTPEYRSQYEELLTATNKSGKVIRPPYLSMSVADPYSAYLRMLTVSQLIDDPNFSVVGTPANSSTRLTPSTDETPQTAHFLWLRKDAM